MTHKSGNMAQSMKDKRGEAMEYDKNAIGVYRTSPEAALNNRERYLIESGAKSSIYGM